MVLKSGAQPMSWAGGIFKKKPHLRAARRVNNFIQRLSELRYPGSERAIFITANVRHQIFRAERLGFGPAFSSPLATATGYLGNSAMGGTDMYLNETIYKWDEEARNYSISQPNQIYIFKRKN